jgi:hypothetical protein
VAVVNFLQFHAVPQLMNHLNPESRLKQCENRRLVIRTKNVSVSINLNVGGNKRINVLRNCLFSDTPNSSIMYHWMAEWILNTNWKKCEGYLLCFNTRYNPSNCWRNKKTMKHFSQHSGSLKHHHSYKNRIICSNYEGASIIAGTGAAI